MPSSKELREVLRNLAQDWRNRMVYAGSDEERSVYPVLADELEAALTAAPEQAPLERDARFLVTPFQPLAQPSTAKQAPEQEAGLVGDANPKQERDAGRQPDKFPNPSPAKAAPSGAASETSAPPDERSEPNDFLTDLALAINKHSRENGSNTPDFLLAEFLARCLIAFDKTSWAREKWYGQHLPIGGNAAGCRGVAAAPQLSEEQVMAAVVIARSQGIAEATKYLNDGPAAPGAGQ